MLIYKILYTGEVSDSDTQTPHNETVSAKSFLADSVVSAS